jgi:hypothetical protein
MKVSETLKMVIKVFWCSGDESSYSVITRCVINREPSDPLSEDRSDDFGPRSI